MATDTGPGGRVTQRIAEIAYDLLPESLKSSTYLTLFAFGHGEVACAFIAYCAGVKGKHVKVYVLVPGEPGQEAAGCPTSAQRLADCLPADVELELVPDAALPHVLQHAQPHSQALLQPAGQCGASPEGRQGCDLVLVGCEVRPPEGSDTAPTIMATVGSGAALTVARFVGTPALVVGERKREPPHSDPVERPAHLTEPDETLGMVSTRSPAFWTCSSGPAPRFERIRAEAVDWVVATDGWVWAREGSEAQAERPTAPQQGLTASETNKDFQGSPVSCSQNSRRAVGAVLEDGTFVEIIPAGTPLPAEGTRDLQVTSPETGHLEIPVAESDGAGGHRVIGTCSLDLPPETPAGTPACLVLRNQGGGLLEARVTTPFRESSVRLVVEQEGTTGGHTSQPWATGRHLGLGLGRGVTGWVATRGAGYHAMLSVRPAPRKSFHFSAFYSERIGPTATGRIIAYAHLPALATEIVQDASRRIDAPGGVPLKAATQAPSRDVPRDSAIRVTCEVPGLQLDQTEATMSLWEDVQSVEFRFRPERLQCVALLCRGWLHFWLDCMSLADLAIDILVAGTDTPELFREALAQVNARAYRTVFPSYSYDDAEVVERLEAYADAFGDRYLRDVRALRTGQNWSSELMAFIHQADVFQLFWSEKAAVSDYIEVEWRRALEERATRPDPHFVRPVYWAPQIAKPIPEELRELHFARVSL